MIRRVRKATSSKGRRGVTSAIITVATMKGGSGKSTLASCLAVHWQLDGRRPAIIDADPQRSLARLATRERALGGVPVFEDATEDAWETAQRLTVEHGRVVIDTPGFRSQSTLACLGTTDFVLVPVKPSPFDVDRMLDTLNILINGVSGRRPMFRCVLTQTTRDSVIAKHIRSELVEAGFPVLENEMINRVAYAEAALWGATPSLIDRNGPAARDIAAIAAEVDGILAGLFDTRRAASA
jgi:chromosome partitioning protein